MCAPWSSEVQVMVSPGCGQGEQRRHVGDGAGDRPDVGELAREDPLGQLDALQLDLVNVDVAAVVALSGQSLGIAVVEVGDHHFLGQGAHEVLRGDHRDRLLEPLVVLLHLFPNPVGIFLHAESTKGHQNVHLKKVLPLAMGLLNRADAYRQLMPIRSLNSAMTGTGGRVHAA